MPKNHSKVQQVQEFMVVGPDVQGLPDELSENPPVLPPGYPPPFEQDDDDAAMGEAASNSHPGPRSWVIKWFGPFYSANLPTNRAAGLYLIYVGNYPLFVSSSANILVAITRHLALTPHRIIPVDLLGREILHYANLYRQPISIKTGLLFEDGKPISPQQYMSCYRRAAAALAYCHAIPCNKYARLKYDFEPLTLTNTGKFFPLMEKFHAKSAGALTSPDHDA
ncbi:MAG: hypothetical protein FWC40_05940 [Proteobacteria bacterium]|nr:hypothetical protein [Pseudomonadota bacterium]